MIPERIIFVSQGITVRVFRLSSLPQLNFFEGAMEELTGVEKNVLIFVIDVLLLQHIILLIH